MRIRNILLVVGSIFVFGKPVSSKVGNYEYYAGVGYYRYVSTANAMNYYAAFDNCVSDGGHLVIINDENEAKVVKELQDQEAGKQEGSRSIDDTNRWWTGINYFYKSWRDVKGNSIESTGYVNWEPGQPEDGNKEPCAVTSEKVTYHDYPCDREYPFICEIEIFK